MSPLVQLAVALCFSVVLMGVLWWRQEKTRDAGIVDIGWSGCLGLLAIFYAVTSEGAPLRRFLLGILAPLWAFRLALHLIARNRGPEEDGRYQTLREQWSGSESFRFFVFFQAQAFIAVVFSVPYLVTAHSSFSAVRVWDWLAIAVFFVSVGGEALADWQLQRFRSRPENRGKTCRRGLWRYSRHPNYFFEWLHWWTWVLMSYGTPYWWLTFLGPLLMLLFLFRLTGIPYTEKQALKSRGEDYRRYQQRTSQFFPWFPDEGSK